MEKLKNKGVDLNNLDKSEAIAARVYIRRRREAYDMLCFIQDLKVGDYISTSIGSVEKVTGITERPDIKNMLKIFDVVVTTEKIPNREASWYCFDLTMAEGGVLDKIIHGLGLRTLKNPMKFDLEINKQAKLLYEKK